MISMQFGNAEAGTMKPKMSPLLYVSALSVFLLWVVTLTISPASASSGDDAEAGWAAYQRGDFEETIRLFTRALKAEDFTKDDRTKAASVLAGAYNDRGFSKMNRGDYAEAIADFDAAIRFMPDLAMAYDNRGIAYARMGQFEKAIADYDAALRLQPGYLLAYNNRCAAYLDTRQYEKALDDCDAALRLKPDFAPAHLGRGTAYRAQGRYDLAITALDTSIRISPSYGAHIRRGQVYRDKHQYDKAIADFDQAIRMRSRSAEAYYERGLTYDSFDDYKDAIKDYSEAIRWKPDFAEAFTNRGVDYAVNREYDKAIADFDNAIRLKPDLARAYHFRDLALQSKRGKKDVPDRGQGSATGPRPTTNPRETTVLLRPPSSPGARGGFGAIAYSVYTGKHAFVSAQKTQKEAEAFALEACGTGCKIIMPLNSGLCAALAVAKDDNTVWGGATRPTVDAARLAALGNCQKRTTSQCLVLEAMCNAN
jgi:tetratricopeptide (TPR) repeat protein